MKETSLVTLDAGMYIFRLNSSCIMIWRRISRHFWFSIKLHLRLRMLAQVGTMQVLDAVPLLLNLLAEFKRLNMLVHNEVV